MKKIKDEEQDPKWFDKLIDEEIKNQNENKRFLDANDMTQEELDDFLMTKSEKEILKYEIINNFGKK